MQMAEFADIDVVLTPPAPERRENDAALREASRGSG